MARNNSREARRKTRHTSIRRKLSGTPERPRLAVFRSSRQIYAQVIDDTKGITLVAASSLDGELREKLSGKKAERAAAVGALLARRALEQKITAVVLDRGGHRYHGRVAALAQAAREAGLDF